MLRNQVIKDNFRYAQTGQRKKYLVIIIAILTSLLASGLLFFLFGCSESRQEGFTVEPVDYKGKTIEMRSIESFTQDGKINISISDIVDNNIVYTEYENGSLTIPLMAYATPTGRIVAAVSICEPCRSTKFFIDGNDLVCSACFTRWELDGMEPISGGCLNYPPDEQGYEVDGDYITLDEEVISSWTPRV